MYIFNVLYIFHMTYRFARDINKIRKDIIDYWARSRKTFRNPTMARLRLTFYSLFSPVWNPRYWNIILTTLLNDNPPQCLVWTQNKGVFFCFPIIPFYVQNSFYSADGSMFPFCVFFSGSYMCILFIFSLIHFMCFLWCIIYDYITYILNFWNNRLGKSSSQVLSAAFITTPSLGEWKYYHYHYHLLDVHITYHFLQYSYIVY